MHQKENTVLYYCAEKKGCKGKRCLKDFFLPDFVYHEIIWPVEEEKN